MDYKSSASVLFQETQAAICLALERSDGVAKFRSDAWERPDKAGSYGGGGLTRVLQSDSVFEQAGVNFSEVHGTLPGEMSLKLVGKEQELPFYATGVSLVIHPRSPRVPTVHANFRYLEVDSLRWFGGGADLTPYVLNEEDGIHFHTILRDACNHVDPDAYGTYKKWCDEYFFLPHRGETRGIGGIFFDYLGKDDPEKLAHYFHFVQHVSASFVEAYVPIVDRRKAESSTLEEEQFQLYRRGRYVEFNLLYDRGTLFGLRTGGRIESILMSLPPRARWEYDLQIEPDSWQQSLIDVLKKPRAWVS